MIILIAQKPYLTAVLLLVGGLTSLPWHTARVDMSNSRPVVNLSAVQVTVVSPPDGTNEYPSLQLKVRTPVGAMLSVLSCLVLSSAGAGTTHPEIGILLTYALYPSIGETVLAAL